MTSVTSERKAPARRRRKAQTSVLFDAPGPRAKRINLFISIVSGPVLLALIALIVRKLNQKGQWDWKLWQPFTEAEVWQSFIIPGLKNTLSATAVAAVLALAFGVVFGLGRLSDHRWARIVCGGVVEFFRSVPVLVMIFFAQAGPPVIADALNRSIEPITAFEAVVIGLTLYNGSVLAEIFRSGVRSIPIGQSEAGYAIGLRKTGVMLRVLLPQAVTAMMPVIVAQVVVLLKDSALGYIIAYEDLLNAGFVQIKSNFNNLIPAAIVITIIYVAMNLTLSYIANWLERRSRRSRKTAATTLSTDVGALPTGALARGLAGETTSEPTSRE